MFTEKKTLMALQSALRFIQQTRRDDVLQKQLQSLAHQAALENIVCLGNRIGLSFTVEELRAAFKYDWAMRWLRQQKRGTK